MKLGIKFSPLQHGSQSTFASNLIQALYNNHSDVELFTENSQLFSQIKGITIHHAENPFLKTGFLRKVRVWCRQQLSLEHDLIKKGIDILYCPYNSEALVKTSKIPQVITVHDLIPLMWQDDFQVTSQLWKYIYLPMIHKCRLIITVSENTKKDILRFCNISPDKVRVVYNGFSKFSSHESKVNYFNYIGEPYILYVSSSHYPYKNLIKLFEAYSSIHLHLHHKLVVVGKTVPRFTPAVYAKVSELGLGEKIVLLEKLTDQKLSSIYKFADLFVYPSLYEGFGIPPLEAMFYNVPVVASEASSIPEVCGEAAIYINPDSVESIANGIIMALNDNNLKQKLQALGKQRASMFSWEKTAKGILESCQMALD